MQTSSSLLHIVDQAIRNSPYLLARNLLIEANSDRITIRGIVSSYFEKQMAQEALKSIEGIGCIENNLLVEYPGAANLASVF